jgi:hypothetical protein
LKKRLLKICQGLILLRYIQLDLEVENIYIYISKEAHAFVPFVLSWFAEEISAAFVLKSPPSALPSGDKYFDAVVHYRVDGGVIVVSRICCKIGSTWHERKLFASRNLQSGATFRQILQQKHLS